MITMYPRVLSSRIFLSTGTHTLSHPTPQAYTEEIHKFIRRKSNKLVLSFQRATSNPHSSSAYYDYCYDYEFLILVKILRSQSTITLEWANTNSRSS